MLDYNKIKISNTSKLRREGIRRRKYNIEAFSKIDRANLEYSKKERKLLLYESQIGEKVYIQYPGKESVSENKERIRPWDFRPKLQLIDGTYMKDLSFADIWDDLVEMHISDDEILAVLATIFFRMVFMVDAEIEDKEYPYIDLDIDNKCIVEQACQKLKWYKYMPDLELINYIGRKIGKIRGASLEAYLYYNDLLAQNEDCKYYYRDTVIKKKDWDNKIGRYNTFMTHITVIEFIQGKARFSEVMNRFQRGRGVAPATQRSLPIITNGLIK